MHRLHKCRIYEQLIKETGTVLLLENPIFQFIFPNESGGSDICPNNIVEPVIALDLKELWCFRKYRDSHITPVLKEVGSFVRIVMLFAASGQFKEKACFI